ncbi:hypothetical protein [Sediminibacterium goheungense]|uniref:Uncharacterized protein n=1 Tax=Sediminibacterium goheungense TaxID=1086393 RepID=A0A4R6J4E6_9BACT|nr:hypothetical protein [Sediminibacterium goheungense]TDO29166.1 hypothetical protein BC659_1249 [Sediminibacterium goheungense]
MGKRIINIFLILVLAVQILPIQQMGKLLYTNQFTEEIPHNLDHSGEPQQSEAKSDFISTPELSIFHQKDFIGLIRPVTADVIPQNHTTEIHVPPPNC